MSFLKAPFQSTIQSAVNKVNPVWQQWFDRIQSVLDFVTGANPSTNRPSSSLFAGATNFDSDLSAPAWWNGKQWLTFNQLVQSSLVAKAYGTFYDNTNQVAASTTVAYPITYNTPNGASNVVVESGSHIKVQVSGVFNVQFSIQFISTENNANNPSEVNVWFRKNGSDIAESNSMFTVPTRHGTHDGALIAALNLLIDLQANDYIELIWQTENTKISMQTLPAGTTPTTPVTPSVILTVQQV